MSELFDDREDILFENEHVWMISNECCRIVNKSLSRCNQNGISVSYINLVMFRRKEDGEQVYVFWNVPKDKPVMEASGNLDSMLFEADLLKTRLSFDLDIVDMAEKREVPDVYRCRCESFQGEDLLGE